MRHRLRRSWWTASLLAGSLLVQAREPAAALVGPAEDGAAFAAHVVMVLARTGPRAGFCSGVVLAPTIVLTAAHCVADAAATRVHFRTTDGTPVLQEVTDVSVHPLYRADAARTRTRSIDLAMVRLTKPLPTSFSAVPRSEVDAVAVGDRFLVAGFGVAQESRPETGGILRSGILSARVPLSKILLWAEDGSARGLGACTGDSGAPIFDASGSHLVAIVDWAEGKGGRACGTLTQAALVAPQRAWIEGVLRRWGR